MAVAFQTTECASCGNAFEQIGRRRTFCETCSPRRGARNGQHHKVAASPKGVPFSVTHFKAWAEQLELSSGAMFVLEPFQELFVADLFAGYRECWLVVPEGNGKTTVIALLALYHIRFRSEAWVPVAASTRDQAGIIYRQASGFVRRNQLEHEFHCHPGLRRIRCDATFGSIQIFAAEASGGDGVIPTLAIIDEPHRHKNLELYRTWAGKIDKEPGAQLAAISTAGEPGGEFELLREQFRRAAVEMQREECYVRAVGTASVLHEYAIPEDGDPEDLVLVKRANPFSGITVETLREKRARPSWTLSHWRRFTCNLPTRALNAAITEAEWFGAVSDEPIPEGEPIWLGLDVAWKHDTTAAVPLWWRDDEFRLFGPAVVLTPPRDGTSLDPHLVEAALVDLHSRNPLHTVVMDTTRAEQLAAWISEEFGATVVDRPQSNAFATDDYERFMEALRMGWLHHPGCPDLTRHVLNAVARVLPFGDARFDRPVEGRRPAGEQERRVIDALTAAAMVHSVAATPQVAVASSWRPLNPEPVAA